MNENELKRKKRSYFVKGSFDIPFFIISIALLTVGLIMLFSASYAYSLQKTNSSFSIIKQQLIVTIPSFIIMLFISKLEYRYLKSFAWLIYGGVCGLLVLVLLLPANSKGFHRWIDLKVFTIQPSDFAKIAIIVLFAFLISKYYERMKDFKFGVLTMGFLLAVVCGLVILEKHVSATIIIAAIGMTMMYVGGTRKEFFILAFVLGIGLLVILYFVPHLDYAKVRIDAWLDKSYDPRGLRWQINNSLNAIGSGGLFGAGLGNSKQKYLYVSEPQNDFIFAIVCEELGFVGASIIICMFVFFIWRGIVIAIKAPDKFGSLLVIGIVAHVGLQTLLNIAVVSDSMPNTGIALPFFSSGGTAMLALLIEIGIVLSVSRQSNLKKV